MSENAALRLAQYLKAFVGLRTTTVRDVTDYESVLWFGDMPQEQDCWSAAWTDEYYAEDPWLEVKKQKFEKPPEPPDLISPWIDLKASRRATLEMPPLKPVALIIDGQAELQEGESAPLIEVSIQDFPEVRDAYEHFKPTWEAWSSEQRRREAIQKIYAELFSLHTQVLKQGEIVEVVLGLGLLDWCPKLGSKAIPVRRHVIIANVELQFRPAKGVIRVVSPGDGAKLRIEDDMLEAEFRPDRSHYLAVQDQLDEIGDAIWDKAQINTALTSWAGALSADSVWSAGLGALKRNGDAPVVSFAPALVLRKRTQVGMVRVYNAIIEQLNKEEPDVPDGWFSLTDDVGDFLITPDAEYSEASAGNAPEEEVEVYFPLPANREQLRIVEAIKKQRGVLVQGPPGTGKSHTIANLICHLLATGKRVLITAETSRALQVLKNKLPDEIKPLCVSLLGQGGDAFAELNSAVQGITTRQATYSPGAYDDRIRELDGEIDSARRRLAEIDSEIRDFRKEETCPHSIGDGAYHGTASAIGKRVASERERFGWLKLPRKAAGAPNISSIEMLSWLKICHTYTNEQISVARKRIPVIAELPSPAEFVTAVEVEIQASADVAKIEDLRSHQAYSSINTLDVGSRELMRCELQGIVEQKRILDRGSGDWIQSAVRDSINGQPARWTALLCITKDYLSRISPLLARLDKKKVDIPANHNLRKVRADANVALSYLSQGGKWKSFGLLTPKPMKGRTYLREEAKVDGEAAVNAKLLRVICDYLDLEFLFEDLKSAWEGVGSPYRSGNPQVRTAELQEQASVLERCIQYSESCRGMAQFMAAANPPIPEPEWLDGKALDWLELVDATFIEDGLTSATRIVDTCKQVLVRLRQLHDVHPAVVSLSDSVDVRDVRAYSEHYAEVVAVQQLRIEQQERRRIEEMLRETVPGLVNLFNSTSDDEEWNSRFGAWEEAWRWAVANNWLEKRSDFKYQQKLWTNRHQVDRKIGGFIAEASGLRAWVYFFKRLSNREAAALKSWREAVRAMGKGTGRSAKMARLRREARQYMDACRDAIPVWIMPRYLVAEMVDPTPGRYDLVIVDEASQLGIESLFLFYIANQMVVVGDDQQISPYGVGVADAAIAGLQQHFLEGIPHHHALSAQSSLYGNAKIRFSQNIVLREHFRCMPEIIQFSNDLCYASSGTPLDPLRAYPANRLHPLVLRHVADGYRIGGAQHAQNPPEADAIVAQVAACIADPRYSGATMGVISLQGEAQAKLIERRLLETLDPEVIQERRLICGDAYAFQGDERNIVFLSLVAAPGETRIGTLATESARQRFNVAVSRAQDQLWLFHTAGLDILSETCMRYRLLSYMLDPTRLTTEENNQRFDSEFERHVYQRITDEGFHVRTQVCVGDPTNHRYRIDLVVEGMEGQLAVECDGDEWHGPDRYEKDMARQRDLERAGWQFFRVRGGDFYRDPEAALLPLWAELDRLEIKPGAADGVVGEPPVPVQLEQSGVCDEVLNSFDINEPPEATHEAGNVIVEGTLGQDTRGAQTVTDSQNAETETGSGAEVETYGQPPAPELELYSGTSGGSGKPKWFAPYVEFKGEPGPDPRQASPAQVEVVLCQIIETEGPMLVKRAYDIYLRGCGIRRMGGELKRALNKALQRAIAANSVLKEDELGKGGLVYSIVRVKGSPPVKLRDRGSRTFEEIPPSELQLVAKRLVSEKKFEVGTDAHLRGVLEEFKLKRLTAQVGMTLLDIMDRTYPHVEKILDETEEERPLRRKNNTGPAVGWET